MSVQIMLRINDAWFCGYLSFPWAFIIKEVTNDCPISMAGQDAFTRNTGTDTQILHSKKEKITSHLKLAFSQIIMYLLWCQWDNTRLGAVDTWRLVCLSVGKANL